MKTEIQIFEILENLCREPGFLEVISFLSWRDTFIHQTGEHLDVEDILKNFDYSKLSRTELSTLIGLACKHGFIEKKLSQNELYDYAQRVDTLMHELHMALMGGNFTLNSIMNDPHIFRSGSVLREAIFYAGDGAYKHQYRDLAKIRYAPDSQWLKENKGFTIDEVIEVFNAIDKLHIIKANSIDTRKECFQKIFQFNYKELAGQCGLENNTIEAVISAFSSLPCEGMQEFNTIDDFNHRNAFPIINLNNGEFISFQSYSLWESLYESPFFWFNDDKAYNQNAVNNRGAYTEDFSENRLTTVFGADNVYKNVNIHKGKKIIGEIDVLVIFGTYALIIQAKSKKLTIEARKGNSQKLEDDFKKAVHNAYDQALECSQFLMEDDIFFKQGDEALDLDIHKIENIIPICIISDYYPALAVQSREFLKVQTTSKIKYPYVMDVFLLDLIAEMLDSPLFFLDYLEKRCSFGADLVSNHELTTLSTYIQHNLYFNGNPNCIMLEDSLSSELELAMLARREGFETERTPNGILTVESRYKFIGGILRSIKNSKSLEKQKLGVLILSLAEDVLGQLNHKLGQMIEASHHGKPHSDITIGISESKTGLTIHCNDIEFIQASTQLIEYCDLRRYSTKADSWVGVIYSPSKMEITFVTYKFSPWMQNDQMDQKAQKMPMKNIPISKPNKNFVPSNTRMGHSVKIGRNEKCPCGSGKKYKRCCLD